MPSLALVPEVTLAIAIVEASPVPMLLMDGGFTIVAASRSFKLTYGFVNARVMRKTLVQLGRGEWRDAGLQGMLQHALAADTKPPPYEMKLSRAGKSDCVVVLQAQALDYSDVATPRLLITIDDITASKEEAGREEARLAENTMRLDELQHRTANCLQIIASLLMQMARRVHSDETRQHLNDAYQRILSVATLQRHLSLVRVGEVRLRPYLVELCRTIGTSMIHDPAFIVLSADVDDSVTDPNTSMSLGLIVTELVINALKHAFREGRGGTIAVKYQTTEHGWILAVDDDGIGTVEDTTKALPGLGTSIVAALARQLKAHVVVASTPSGTSVSISRS